MEAILIYVVLGLVYLISFLIIHSWLRKAHSKGGRWSNIDPEVSDIFFSLFPVINTFMALVCLFKPHSREGVERREKAASRFFNVKK